MLEVINTIAILIMSISIVSLAIDAHFIWKTIEIDILEDEEENKE